MMTQTIEYVSRWLAQTEPALDRAWSRTVHSGNTGLVLTRAEARQLEQDFERLIQPLATRTEAETPKLGRRVRLVRFLLPDSVDADLRLRVSAAV